MRQQLLHKNTNQSTGDDVGESTGENTTQGSNENYDNSDYNGDPHDMNALEKIKNDPTLSETQKDQAMKEALAEQLTSRMQSAISELTKRFETAVENLVNKLEQQLHSLESAVPDQKLIQQYDDKKQSLRNQISQLKEAYQYMLVQATKFQIDAGAIQKDDSGNYCLAEEITYNCTLQAENVMLSLGVIMHTDFEIEFTEECVTVPISTTDGEIEV